MGLFGQLKLALQGKRLVEAVEKEARTNMSWKKTLLKGLWDFTLTTLALVAATYAADNNALREALGGLPVPVRDALVPVLSALFVMTRNAGKQAIK